MSTRRSCLINLRAFARAALLSVACVATGAATSAAAQTLQIPDHTAAQIASLLAEKETRNAAQRKVVSQLLYAGRMAKGVDIAPGVPRLEVDVAVDSKGMVEVDIRTKEISKVEALVRQAGGDVVRSFAFANSVEALVPLDMVEAIAADDAVTFIAPKAMAMLQSAGRPVGIGSAMEPPTLSPRLQRFKETVARAVEAAHVRSFAKSGAANSQGDATHRASDVRNTLGFTGAGMCVGVLSDSFNSAGAAAADMASGDLPSVGAPFAFSQPVAYAGSGDAAGSDEGRAMIQIVHDLAPGARLYFATAFNSIADFANNIRALRGIAASPGAFGNVFPKCDIVVDDVFYFTESGLHDGQPAPSSSNIAIVSQAVADVVNDGGLYFSSAGNSGGITQGTAGAWEGDYVGGALPAAITGYADALIWSGASVTNQIVTNGSNAFLHWSDPVGASTNDYDLCRLNGSLALVGCVTNIQNGTQDPVEGITTVAGHYLVVVRKAGAAARFMSLTTNRGTLQFATTGQTRGHSASALGMGVAATPAATTFGAPTPNGPFPNPFVASNQIERFSSDGPRRSFFNADGSAITPGNFLAGTGGGVVRAKPDMTAADGVSTTLPAGGLNPFYGTSAAAPHAGAIAALMKQGTPNALPAAITNVMKSTALDIMAPGVDRDSGAGIVQAFQAVQAIGATPAAIVRPTAVNIVPSGGNSVLEPNECNTVNIPLINEGPQGATAVSATLTSSTPGVAITKGSSSYPNLAANGGTASGAVAFEVSTSKKLACLGTASFTQTVQFTGGVAPRSYSFMLPIGVVSNYTFASQASVGLPAGGVFVAGSNVDDGLVSITVPAGFNFSVYGTAVTGGSTLRASSNGNLQIQPSGGSSAFSNATLPSATFTANPVVVPYWDDLDLTVAGGGIYTNLVGVAPNRQFVVEWRGKHFESSSPTTAISLTFGVLFNENSSTIEYRYPLTSTPVSPNGSSATVGVQNTAVVGQYTQFSFNQPVITSGTVIRGTLSAGCAVGAVGQCTTPLFADVPNGYWAAREINTVYNTVPRVTNGCLASPLNFCPTATVTREQMAAFIIRALEGEPSPTLCAGGSPFPDVSQGSLFCPYIKRMQALGITNGCGSGNYCPLDGVTREQTVVFLIRALEGDPSPTLCSGGAPFTDVSAAAFSCPHIVRAVARGITNGCTPTTFCPTQQTLRSEMAVFLTRAFGL